MKKGILTLLVMLLMLAALVTIGSVAADGDEGAPFEIAAKSISTKENLVLNFKVSVPEGADLSTLSLLLWESVPEDGFTAESETAVSLALAGRESESGYYVFCYDGIEDKELGREVYVRACYRDGEETIYTETVRYSVAIYLYTMRQTAEGEFLSLLDSLIARGNAARDAALAAGDENVGPALDGMATVTLTDAHFADGSRTGRFLVGQEITAYADNEGTLFWKSGSTTLSDSASDTLTFTVTENASYRPLYYTEGLEFSISNGEATVTDYNGSSTSVVIPASYNGDPVTSIGDSAFYRCTSLTSITIPESVTSIGDGAFRGCSSLESVTFGENSQLTSIGDSAFSGCSSLNSVTFGENSQLTSIGNSAFRDCSSLTSITIPESVTIIGSYAFRDCSSLESITIPDTVTSIGYYAFRGCSSLVYNEYDNAYYLGNDSNPYLWLIKAKSENITSCNIHTATKGVYYGAFSGCSSLVYNEYDNAYYLGNDSNPYLLLIKAKSDDITSCNIHTATKYVCSDAFYYCTSLKSIAIPDGVTSIGEFAFYGCSSLASVTFGENSQLTSIGGDAFYYCSSLTSVYITNLSSWCNIAFGSASANPLLYAGNLYLNQELVTELTIPESVTSIGEDTFRGCSSLTSIVIPDDVTSIGEGAFAYCSSLTSITIPESVTSIGEDAFRGCSSLESITIPESVTSIGDYAFEGCSSLTSLTIPESVTSIGEFAFYGCSSLTSITIPSSVTSIGNAAFYDCTSLASVTFGENSQLTSIGEDAFKGCSSLESITIPESVTSIGYGAFSSCSSLTSVTIPGSVTSIGDGAFSGCYKLVEVINHSSLKIVAGYSAHGYVASYAKEVHTGESKIQNQNGYLFYTYNDIHYLLGYTGEEKELILPDSYLGEAYEICDYAFYGCSSLTSIVIPDGVASIGNSAFYRCYKLVEVINHSSLEIVAGDSAHGCVAYYAKEVHTGESKIQNQNGYLFYTYNDIHYLLGYTGEKKELILPDSYLGEVYEIYDYAFSGCSSLTSITIPEGVTIIGNSAFEDCTSLKSITIPGSVTIIGSSAFGGCSSLASVAFGENSQLTSIGGYSFSGCSSLLSITIPDSVTSIGEYAFSDCSSLNSVTFGENSQLTSIDSYAFYRCSSLTSVAFGENSQLTSIGRYAFYVCSSLESITIPESVTSIGNYAFYYCSSLVYNEYDNAYYLGNDSNPYLWLIKAKSNDITSCNIHTASKHVCSDAFYGCSSLTSVIFGENSQLTSIGSWAFDDCSSLTSITIPESVTSIGSSAFRDCTALEELYFNATAMNDLSSDNYVFYNAGKNGNGIKVVVGAGVTKIPAYLFSPVLSISSCSPKITSVEFEGGSVCESIGNYAFGYCSSLTSITIPESVTSIGGSAFRNCTALEEIYFNATAMNDLSSLNYVFFNAGKNGNGIKVVIGAGVTKIPAYLFYPNYSSNSPKITSVEFEDGSVCESIGARAFYYCTSLTSITYAGTRAEWNSINKGYDWNNETGNYILNFLKNDTTDEPTDEPSDAPAAPAIDPNLLDDSLTEYAYPMDTVTPAEGCITYYLKDVNGWTNDEYTSTPEAHMYVVSDEYSDYLIAFINIEDTVFNAIRVTGNEARYMGWFWLEEMPTLGEAINYAGDMRGIHESSRGVGSQSGKVDIKEDAKVLAVLYQIPASDGNGVENVLPGGILFVK